MLTFEPSSLTTFELRNRYQTMFVKVRLEGTGDEEGDFHEGDTWTYTVDYRDSENTYIQKGGHTVQQLDLNDGKSADDLNMPRTGKSFNESNTLKYISSSPVIGPSGDNGWVLADFTTGKIDNGEDADGINVGPAALLTTEILDNGARLVVTLRGR